MLFYCFNAHVPPPLQGPWLANKHINSMRQAIGNTNKMIDWRLGVGEEDVDGMDDRFCFSLGVQGLFLGYFKITVLGILKVYFSQEDPVPLSLPHLDLWMDINMHWFQGRDVQGIIVFAGMGEGVNKFRFSMGEGGGWTQPLPLNLCRIK